MATALLGISKSDSCGGGKRIRNRQDLYKKIVKSNVVALEKKLRKMDAYKSESQNYVRTLAQHLSTPSEIASIYFSSITYDLIHQNLREHSRDVAKEVTSLHDKKLHTAKSIKRVDSIAKFEVKLLLRYVDARGMQPKVVGRVAAALNMEYGPLHTSLLINDHILVEWSDSSVIIPRIVDPEEDIVKLAAATIQDIPPIKCEVSGPYQIKNETDLVFEAARQKLEFVNRLATVIARYNNLHHYDIIFRNCQNFIADALTELGCSDGPKFSKGMEKYFKYLRENGKVLVEFGTHEELDWYVQSHVASLSAENIEYLLTQYFLFHHRAMVQDGLTKKWECPNPQCMAELLEIKIKEKTLIMSRYLHVQSV